MKNKVIFHSYVSLPEGTLPLKNPTSLHQGLRTRQLRLCGLSQQLGIGSPRPMLRQGREGGPSYNGWGMALRDLMRSHDLTVLPHWNFG